MMTRKHINVGCQLPNSEDDGNTIRDTASDCIKSYPRLSLWIVVIGAACAVACLAAFAETLDNGHTGIHEMLFFGMVFSAGIVYEAVASKEINLYDSRIEASGLFGDNVLQRHEICGYHRKRFGRSASILEIVPNDRLLQSIKAPWFFAEDRTFSKWLEGIRNLDDKTHK